MNTEPPSPAAADRDMSEQEFRAALARVAEWVLDYRARAAALPVLARVRPGEVLGALPAEPPAQPEPLERWLNDLDEIILPAITHWNHPGFLAYFPTTGSAPGVLGELIAAALNANGMLWKTSPAATELEQLVLRWCARALGLPADWFGLLTDTASTSTLMALTAARDAAGLPTREQGLSSQPPLVFYCSEEAHSSVEKAALVLGLGRCGVRRISTDAEFRLRPEALEAAIRKDLAAGRKPFAVVATVGTTSATAVDPVPQMADLCQQYGLWLHVDAAYAGSAAIAPEFRWALAGCERADSFVANPHKWLFTTMDCSALLTRRPEAFHHSFSLTPEYLRTDADGAVDLMNYTFQLGRRFRALKLWFVFRCFGTEGIAARIRAHVHLAREFAAWVDAHPQLERLAPVNFSVVCFRVHPAALDDEAVLEKLNADVLEQVNASGKVFLSHTRLRGRYCLRLAIGNLGTTREQIRTAFELVCHAARLC